MEISKKTENELGRELSENLIAYIDLKKDDRVITHNSLSLEECQKAKILTRKVIPNYSEKDADLEKKVFKSLLEVHTDAGLHKKENGKFVVFDAGITPVMISPDTKEKIRGILIMYSYIYD